MNTTVVWFRQDLRLSDNPALDWARGRGAVVPLFIWAPDEEGKWTPGGASRWYLHQSLEQLAKELKERGSRLVLRRGDSLETLREVGKASKADAVVWNRRYEPAVIKRDTKIKKALSEEYEAKSFNGSLLFDPGSVMTGQGKPYQVYTPFWRACLAADAPREVLPTPRSLDSPWKWPKSDALDDFELEPKIDWASGMRKAWKPGFAAARRKLKRYVDDGMDDYEEKRNRVDLDETSMFSPHLHFGEISPNQVWYEAAGSKRPFSDAAKAFVRQIVWREFAHHLLYHFPETTDKPLREKFENFPWRRDKRALEKWQKGQTGYPIVDAAMRDLWERGWMPNRARMIVASFLTKHLLLPWQEGAKWFWDTLVDADLANNTLGWQWTAGCGADAAPYFRIFNPITQGEKFDPDGDYIATWVPEVKKLALPDRYKPWESKADALEGAGVKLGKSYPKPIVDHAEARERALDAYETIKGK